MIDPMSPATRRGWALIGGAVVTLAWMLLCPKYEVQGTTSHVYRSGDEHTAQGMRFESRQHPEPTYFWGGVLVIWASVGGLYCFKIAPSGPFSPLRETTRAEEEGPKG